jgi:hypothetical protein
VVVTEQPVDIGSAEWHQNLSRYMMTLQSIIDKEGWAIQGVGGGETTSPFCYTVGVHDVQDLPELMIVGVPFEVGAGVLNEIASETILKGDVPDTWQLADDYVARVVPERSCDTRNLKAGILHQYYREHVQLCQVVWPAENGAYPGDADWPYDPDVQPLLDAWSRP